MKISYDIVIPTRNRATELHKTLSSILTQKLHPQTITVVDASLDNLSREVCQKFGVDWQKAEGQPSAAQQRNQGSKAGTAPIVIFCDDDITLEANTTQLLVSPFKDKNVGGITARLEGCELLPPSRITRLYYRIQSGFSHPHYGARLLPPAITTYPCYQIQGYGLVPAEWLNSGLVAYRREAFSSAGKFPNFEGYSAFEDVWLSAVVAKEWGIFYQGATNCTHRDDPNEQNRSAKRKNTAMHFRNLKKVSITILGIREPELTARILLHKIFVSISLLRFRPPHFKQSLAGIWISS